MGTHKGNAPEAAKPHPLPRQLVRRTRLLWAFLIVQLGLVVMTALPPFSPRLGAPVWHHNASLGVTLAAFLGTGLVRTRSGRLWSDRAHLGLGVLWWTFLATASGFLLLYLKQDLKDWELKDWAKWWHIAWSWLALWYFVAHTAVNWKAMVKAMGRWLGAVPTAIWYYGLLGAIVLAVPLSWSAWGARTITDGNYILLTLWTWLVLCLPAYTVWGIARLRALRGRPISWAARRPVVAFVDVWLLPMAILANISGFPILWFATKDTSLKYVAKYWHTWPSIAFAILVFAHSIQWWLAVRVHWRKAADATA